MLRVAEGQAREPSATVLESWISRPSPESGEPAGYDGAKRKKGSKLHMAVDTLGRLLALHVTPTDADDRAQVDQLAKVEQVVTGESVEVAFVDQCYLREEAGSGRS
ncbi:transposase [Methylobacterium mesophilicum]